MAFRVKDGMVTFHLSCSGLTRGLYPFFTLFARFFLHVSQEENFRLGKWSFNIPVFLPVSTMGSLIFASVCLA